MRARIVLCAVSAVLAILLVAGYAGGVRNQAAAQRAGALERYGGETARVCVTTAAVARGETFTERNVTTVDWLVDLLPEGAQTDASQVMGRVSAATLAPNTPLSDVDLETQGSTLDVPAGTSAVCVPCSAESAVGGALAPGSSVDLYVVADGTARLLSQGVQVLQTSAGASGGKLAWVTIAVDPAQVEAVVAAASLQRLSFVLPAEDVGRAARAAGGGVASSAAGEGAGSQVGVATGAIARPDDGARTEGSPEPDVGQAEGSSDATAAPDGAEDAGTAREDVAVEGAADQE